MTKLTTRQKIIGCRKMLDMTQEDIAKKLNMHRITYSRKENNPELFTLNEINKIQELFNNSLENAPDIF